MAADKREIVRVLRNGAITVPAEVRRRHGWAAGTVLFVEDAPQGARLTDKDVALAAPPSENETAPTS